MNIRFFSKIIPFFIVIFLISCQSGDKSDSLAIQPTSPVEQIAEVQSITPEQEPTQEVSPTSLPSATQLPTATQTEVPVQPARGIILFIGDGMGANHRLAAQYVQYGLDGNLVMDLLPVHGSVITQGASDTVTDSAASATAYATGVQTFNKFLSIDPEGNHLETILEQAQALGWSTGLVTSVSITHATPAAFASHIDHRNKEKEIAVQIMDHDLDVLLGGGENFLLPRSDEVGCYPGKGQRQDGLDLIMLEKLEGVEFVCTAKALANLDLTNVDRLMGIFGDDGMKQPYSPTLAEMTEAALEVLSKNPNGFFLMVEAGQIDWESHDNESELAIQLTLGFDQAVASAISFTADNPEVLLIVTADHETGGLSLNMECDGSYRQDGPFTAAGGESFCVDWEGGKHTGANVPLTAIGPFSELLDGENPNTWVYHVMYAALTGVYEE